MIKRSEKMSEMFIDAYKDWDKGDDPPRQIFEKLVNENEIKSKMAYSP
jgi:hypothetical protein